MSAYKQGDMVLARRYYNSKKITYQPAIVGEQVQTEFGVRVKVFWVEDGTEDRLPMDTSWFRPFNKKWLDSELKKTRDQAETINKRVKFLESLS